MFPYKNKVTRILNDDCEIEETNSRKKCIPTKVTIFNCSIYPMKEKVSRSINLTIFIKTFTLYYRFVFKQCSILSIN